MAKHLIKGYITSTQYGLRGKPIVGFCTYKPTAEYSPNTVIVAEHEFEVDVPDNFDPRPAMASRSTSKSGWPRLSSPRRSKSLTSASKACWLSSTSADQGERDV